MAQEREVDLFRGHADPVVGHPDELAARVLQLHGDGARPGVDRVFHQLLDHRGRPLHDLARGDLVHEVIRQPVDPAHGRSRSRSCHAASRLSACSGVRPPTSSCDSSFTMGSSAVGNRPSWAGSRRGPAGREGGGELGLLALEVGEDAPGARDHRGREPGEPGDLDAVRAVGAARAHLVEEDDLVVPLLDRHVEVRDAGQPLGERGQLVIVGGEHHLGPLPALVQLLRHRPGDGEAIERGGAAAHLVEEDEAARRRVVQDARRLDHLDQEGALAPREIVLGPDARQDAIDEPDGRRARGDEGADLRHDHEERGLAHEHALAAHVGPGQDDDLAAGWVEPKVVGRERRRPRLEHRMAAVDDLERLAVVHVRPHVAPLVGDVRQPHEDVERAHRPRRPQELLGVCRDLAAHLDEQLELEARDALLRPEHAALVLLQLRRDIALGADQRLAPDIVGGHLLGMRVADLDRIPEHAVEADAEASDPRPLALAPLEGGDPVPRLARRALEVAQLRVPSLADEAALAQAERRLVLQRLVQQLA